jgi:PB1 domain
VDHSLKKLQLIIDSVHGADPAIKLTALYQDLTKAPTQQNNSPKNKKRASSGSNNSSSIGPSSNGTTRENDLSDKNIGDVQKENVETEQGTRKKSQENGETWSRIKAAYGSDNIRLRLDPSWGVKELKDEICSRFNIGDSNFVNLRYLDDDSEWILIACDADLKECIHVYKSSKASTIKICVQTARKS